MICDIIGFVQYFSMKSKMTCNMFVLCQTSKHNLAGSLYLKLREQSLQKRIE